MKRSLILILAIITVFVISSCKTTFRISVRTPPPILLNDGTTQMLIINNVTDDNSPDKLIAQVLQGQQYNGNVMAAEQAVTGIIRSLDDSQFLKGMAGNPAELRSDKLINWNRIE